MKQIFPNEFIENTVEVHEFKHSKKGEVIYFIILFSLISAFVSLPFLKIDVYTTARGIIKPNKERVTLTVINSGRIIYSSIHNNKKVVKGDTLLIIDNNGIDDQLDFTQYQLEETKLFIEDLSFLLNMKSINTNFPITSKYQKVRLQYEQKLWELRVHLEKIRRDFQRSQTLFSKGVIAKSEYEDKQFEYDLAVNDIRQFKKQQNNSWQSDLIQFERALKELVSKEKQLLKTKSRYVITAPIQGTLLSVRPQELGNFISVGTAFGEISPDTDLLVECYVGPTDIGLLTEGNNINFQIDAYNYNQWGLATGKVIEIGRDMELIDNQPSFKVRCRMNEKYLSLKNGFQGNLKKGMTLNANFELTERSLFDLLYDKMDDWLNPSRNEMTELKP